MTIIISSDVFKGSAKTKVGKSCFTPLNFIFLTLWKNVFCGVVELFMALPLYLLHVALCFFFFRSFSPKEAQEGKESET